MLKATFTQDDFHNILDKQDGKNNSGKLGKITTLPLTLQFFPELSSLMLR